jgi:ribonuclease P protein component
LLQLFTYNKTEKLKSRKQLDIVFKNGKSFLVFPLKVFVVFEDISQENLIQCGVGVSKKHFSKAVERNKIKRILRENYRLNKGVLHETITAKQLSFFILYIDKSMPEKSNLLDDKMKKVFEKICLKYQDELAS